MDEDVSVSLRLSVTVWLTAALLGVTSGILVMSLQLLNNYNNKYVNATVAAADSGVNNLQSADVISGASAYAAVSKSINSIDKVYIVWSNGSTTVLYNYKTATDNTITLMTNYKNDEFELTVCTGELISSLKTVKLTEVVR